MNLSLPPVMGWLREHYDKAIAAAGLLLLCFSLVYLAVKIGTMRRTQEEFVRQMESFVPLYPTAKPIDVSPYEEALAKLENPRRITAWTNAALIPEARVWCVDCRLPIPIDANICTYDGCQAQQPPRHEDDPLWDYDSDGIPDLWEKLNHLDPMDPDDALDDSDGDDFINLVEFRADPQTDLRDLTKKHGTGINDPDDYPPPEKLLVVTDITGDPFDLSFQGKVKRQDGELQFQLNIQGGLRTVWPKMGDTVAGFKLVDYKEVITTQRIRGVTMRVDESVLTLKRGNKLILLVYKQPVPYTEYTAELMFMLDETTYTVKLQSIFELKGKQFRVNEIDIRRQIVVVVRRSDGKRFEVGKVPVKRDEQSPAGGPREF